VGKVMLAYVDTYSSEKSLCSRLIQSANTATVTIAAIAQSACRALNSKDGMPRRAPSTLATIE
jgi:hypothetical protein